MYDYKVQINQQERDMAEIDDALPNVVTEDTDIELQETEVAVPGEEIVSLV